MLKWNVGRLLQVCKNMDDQSLDIVADVAMKHVEAYG